MALTQDNRNIAIQTPLGKDVLLLESFRGSEGLSRLFSYEVRLLSEVNHAIAFKDVVGKPVTISVKHAKGKRFINGIVRRFSQGGGDATLASYQAEVVPTLWLLTQTADCRIFQNKTVPDIIQALLKEKGISDVELNLAGSYQPREYCVQYRETDFNFISRLMEQEGIFYFFKHADGKHTLVLGNSPGAHPACTPATARFHWTFGATVLDEDVVTEFAMEQQIRPGKFAMTDYNFTMPKSSLQVSASNPSGDAKLDIYDYPGEYQKRDEGDRLVRIRIEEEEAGVRIGRGAGGCAQFTAGHTFTLSEFRRRDLNEAYVLAEVSHAATQNGYFAGDDGEYSYQNRFLCIPQATPFRPPRITPRPVVQGSQTAEVVGVPGEEIYTDLYGRVKVQFHWDREGKRNEQSSCWIRVSQPWAGKGWGSVSIPRIGQEVVVDFLEGDPDQPIVIGRVYNAEQVPPYTLPAGGVVSGIKSNSTKGGGGYNEIVLDDTKGTELIRIHGQYDLETVIEHDRKETIKHDDALKVSNNRSKSIGSHETAAVGGNRQSSVEGNETLSVGGNRSQSVSKNEAIDIGGNRSQSVAKKEQVSIGDERTQDVAKNDKLEVGKALIVTAGDSITIATGEASITMKKSGEIVIKGKDIKIEGSGKIAVKASSDVTIKGSKVSTN